MFAGIPLPQLQFGGLLLGLLAVMAIGGRTLRSGSLPIGSNRALALGAVYAVMYFGLAGPSALTACLFSLLGLLVVSELARGYAGAGVPLGVAWLTLLWVCAAALPWWARSIDGPGSVRNAATAALAAVLVATALAAWRALRPLTGATITLAALIALDVFPLLRAQPKGAAVALFAFFVINVADTAAYFAGKAFGRHKLAAAISPGKTVEGAIGSLLVTIPVAWLFARVLQLPLTPRAVTLAAILLNGLALAGDLLESLLKRRLGLKDFGALLGGHGGVLDRFDSCILAVPAFALWLQFTR